MRTSVAGASLPPLWTSRLPSAGSTSRTGPKTWHRCGRNGATPPMPSASSAGGHRTRGLFLDRRAFLTSYDPTQDDAEHTILTRILQAVLPVCAGINLEYYFSYVDNPGWGCGTKLPHNIAALVGVMDGAASDLRTGLPWQMVEIHEPVRLLQIVESTPEAMLRILDRHAGHRQIVPQQLGSPGCVASDDPRGECLSQRPISSLHRKSSALPGRRVLGGLVSRLARPSGVCPTSSRSRQHAGDGGGQTMPDATASG